MASTKEGPDFICIGMPKAGTDWLFDQLQYHPDFWMPPVKEIAYLVHKKPRLKHVNTHYRRLGKGELKRASKKRPGDERDQMFVEEAARLTGEPRSLKRYADLFRYKNGLLSGDITPAYCRLNRAAVREVAEGLAGTKIVLLVRDPIERLWSHISMLYRTGKFNAELLENPAKFREFLDDPANIERRSFATDTAMRWKNWAPGLPLKHFFFDEIQQRPAEARRQILQFLGADADKTSGTLPPDYNRKADEEKLPLSDAVRELLIKRFRRELRASAKLFGGYAENWAARYGV